MDFRVGQYAVAIAILMIGCHGFLHAHTNHILIPYLFSLWGFFDLLLIFVVTPIALTNWGPSLPNLPPGPFRFPLIGNLLCLDKHVPMALWSVQRNYRNIMSLVFGSRTVIVVDSPEYFQLLMDQESGVASRPPPDHINVYHQILNFRDVAMPPAGQDEEGNDLGAYWKRARKIFTHQFTPKELNRYTDDVLIDEIQAMVAAIMCHAGVPYDITETFKNTSLNIILRITYSLRLKTNIPDLPIFTDLKRRLSNVSSLRPEHAHLPKVIDDVFFVIGQPNLPDFFPFLRLFNLPPPLSWIRPAATLRVQKDKIFTDLLNEHRKTFNVDNIRDFLDLLISQSGDLSDDDILDISWDQIAAGTDTSSTTIAWFVRLLAKYPLIQQKLHAEMEKICESRWPTLDDQKNLPYLNATILEVLRFKPVGPLHVPRYATRTLSIKGMTIPRGSLVWINWWSIARDPLHWKNPEEFRPERFLEEESHIKLKLGVTDPKFTPFGGGRRICAGFHLAEREVYMMASALIHNFEFFAPNGPDSVDLTEVFGLTLQPKSQPIGVKIRDVPHSY